MTASAFKNHNDKKKFNEALSSGDIDSIISIIDKDIGPNLRLNDDMTVLSGLLDFMNWDSEPCDLFLSLEKTFAALIEKDADFTVGIGNNYSILGFASSTKISEKVLDRMVELGAEPFNQQEDLIQGMLVPLKAAKSTERIKWGMDLLQSKYANHLSPDVLGACIADFFFHEQGGSAWHWRAEDTDEGFFHGGHFCNAIEVLIEYGANLNAKSSRGLSGTMGAAMTWMPEALEFLISKGADVNIIDNNGQTALMYVCGYLPNASPMNEKWKQRPEHLQIAKILVQAGADINLINKRGDTALDLARKNKNMAVLKYLQSL